MSVLAKIRVLECIRQGKIGGGESHLLSLVENLDRSVFEPIVLSFTDGPMIERLREMDVPVHIIYTEKPFDIRKWKIVKDFIKKQKVDLIHAHGTRANSNILWAARSLKIPVIYTVHGWSFHQDQNIVTKTARIMGEKYLTSRSNLNISVSYSNKQSGKKFIPSFESIVINNGINQNRFNPSRKLKDVRAELKISPSDILVLFIARFTSHKQPLTLIKAFAESQKANHSLKLLMVGDGDEKEEATQLIKQLNLEYKIILQSFRQDVEDVLAAADIFVLPSLWEGLPIGLLEAMAMGKAVIATNVDGTSEVIHHNSNGYMVETDNLVSNLSHAINVVSNDPELRKRFSQKAIETINEKYNAIGMTKEIEKTYYDLCKHEN